MSSPEFEEILASLQAVVRRAYVLGRSEALKQVVEVMKADEQSWRPLALAAPVETGQTAGSPSNEPPHPGNENESAVEPTSHQAPTAWWMQPARPALSKRQAGGG